MKTFFRLFRFAGLILFFSACIHAEVAKDKYPDIWWKHVPEDQLSGWEIPPQAADREKGFVVLSKRNELGQFSNLGPAEFILDNQVYASVEGLWQGMKYPEGKNDERLKD